MKCFLGFITSLIVFALAAPVLATTVLPLNLAQLSEAAESAFVLRVDSVESTVTQGRAHDTISGTVVEPVFGDVATSQVITWDQFKFGLNRPMQGMPGYAVGKEYLIFLSGKASATGFQMPVGLQQGAFDVIRNRKTGAALVRNDLGNAMLVRGLDVPAVAKRMARDEALNNRLRGGVSAETRAAEIAGKLRPARSGNSLDAVKDAARFFHRERQSGRMASRDFQTTAGATGSRPLHL